MKSVRGNSYTRTDKLNDILPFRSVYSQKEKRLRIVSFRFILKKK